MSETIKNRSELLFCYDITDANPNGDPLDENKPRIDEETNINFVTDVRLKRTIRDYFFEHKGFNGKNGKDIFIREIKDEDEYVKDIKQRVMDFIKTDGLADKNEIELVKKYLKDKITIKDAQNLKKIIGKTILNENIDTRLFGATYAVEFPKTKMGGGKFTSSITYTGPVQFKIGRSLHEVRIKPNGHSFTMSSGEKKKQGSLAPEYILPYSFIAFHGIINQNAAQHTKMTDADVKLLLEGMWLGTKNLISRSKFGQMPRFLVKVNYRYSNFFIGDLDKKIKLTNFDNEFKIRSIKDFKLDMSELNDALKENNDKIESIEYFMDSGLRVDIPSDWIKLTL
ncbi:MAG: type I-B CRISPR-associated protein Cas7/Csh2 [Desulfobacteraceae bacterium 4572_130]|nr:MAG: type I-B CRISPR-associated protein Cas7/Csh2 [Desulfobacteraceae bacterium 4572_130]